MSLSSPAGAFCFSLGPCSMNLHRVRMQVRGACSFTLIFVHCLLFYFQLRLGHLELPLCRVLHGVHADAADHSDLVCAGHACQARVFLSTVMIRCKMLCVLSSGIASAGDTTTQARPCHFYMMWPRSS